MNCFMFFLFELFDYNQIRKLTACVLPSNILKIFLHVLYRYHSLYINLIIHRSSCI